jgi:ribosomal protein S18 acetylase RimI-like enzyme
VVEWVAVLRNHRGQGIVGHLLRDVLALGANRSKARSQISTYLGNQAAVNAYRKAGFGFHFETRDPAFAALLGVPGMVTMVRALP